MKQAQINKIKIRKGDTVRVMAGKDRGKEGKVERVYPKRMSVLVAGVNEFKRHVKPRDGRPGEVVSVPRPLNIAKVMVVDPKTKQPVRVGWKLEGDKKIRINRKNQAAL